LGKAERFQEFAEEMVRLKADVIVVITTPAALVAKNATTTIPIVFPTAIDPVGIGNLRHLLREKVGRLVALQYRERAYRRRSSAH
jgi:putative ABC transport system substrate-binding protein